MLEEAVTTLKEQVNIYEQEVDQKPDKDPNQQRLLMEAKDLKQRKNQNILVLKRGLRFIDQRLLEKLSLLEQSGDTEKMKSYVTDLWSTMKNRGG